MNSSIFITTTTTRVISTLHVASFFVSRHDDEEATELFEIRRYQSKLLSFAPQHASFCYLKGLLGRIHIFPRKHECIAVSQAEQEDAHSTYDFVATR